MFTHHPACSVAVASLAAALLVSAPVRADDPPPAVLAYGVGLGLQKMVETCDVRTTGAQRTALTAKLAALKGLIEPGLLAAMEKQPVPADCPSDAKEQDEFAQMLAGLLDKTPEQFVAMMNAGPSAASAPPAGPAPQAGAASGAASSAKSESLGGALALRRQVELCDIPTTGQQRASLDGKIKTLVGETGITPSDQDTLGAAINNRLKSEYCPAYREQFPAMLSALMQDLPSSEWATYVANQAAAGSTKKVGDWTVNVQSCDATYSYYDKNDQNRLNGVFFGRSKTGVKILVQYENWRWSAGDKLVSKLSLNDKLVNETTNWTAPRDGQYLQTQFDGSLLPYLATANSLTLGFEKGNAEFNTPGAGEALRALEECSAK